MLIDYLTKLHDELALIRLAGALNFANHKKYTINWFVEARKIQQINYAEGNLIVLIHNLKLLRDGIAVLNSEYEVEETLRIIGQSLKTNPITLSNDLRVLIEGMPKARSDFHNLLYSIDRSILVSYRLNLKVSSLDRAFLNDHAELAIQNLKNVISKTSRNANIRKEDIIDTEVWL